MHTVQSGEKSGQEVSLLEWQTCDSDAEWQTPAQVMLTTAVSPTPDVMPRTSWATRYWRIGAVLVVLVAAISEVGRGVSPKEGSIRLKPSYKSVWNWICGRQLARMMAYGLQANRKSISTSPLRRVTRLAP